ncbi:MAG: hypothetical protein U5J63_08060 [Fodinibius sp.]|nr:hypothetical protein [Fodinibius sp.]
MSKEYGAEIPFMRSDETADDYATTVEVLLEVIHDYGEMDKTFENVCCLYTTAPFVTTKDLKKWIRVIRTSQRLHYPPWSLNIPYFEHSNEIKTSKLVSLGLSTKPHGRKTWKPIITMLVNGMWIKTKTLLTEQTC